jgi:DUF1680 family protein
MHLSRRSFLASSVGLLSPRWGLSLGEARPTGGLPRPISQGAVRLLPGPLLDAAEVNRRFLLGLEPDQLLHTFRIQAGLPSSATPLGGWEAPENELRGHFTGHYLSACALRFAGFGDQELKARGDAIVGTLSRCQAPSGYLSAFPEQFFGRLRAGEKVWAPFYTLHKIMAGLLDMHLLAGNLDALRVAAGMARWTGAFMGSLNPQERVAILEREFGGMNEVLDNLGARTGDQADAELARAFDHERVFGPLARGEDALSGVHANTTIPKIIGAARRYELTGDERFRRIAEYFWNEVTGKRCYATGGTSEGESWSEKPGILPLSGYTEESCCTYNMLKLTRQIYSATGNPRCMDYYERALFNGILGTQHPEDGSKLYYLPLASGFWKLFGTPLADFWCCTGTLVESFAKLGDSAYFSDDEGILLNLLVASELRLPEQGLRLVQETAFPERGTSRLSVFVETPRKFSLKVRVPSWARAEPRVSVNGEPAAPCRPGTQSVLTRVWRTGDTVDIAFPMGVSTEELPGDPERLAFRYGPLVLAARLGSGGLRGILRAGPTKPRTVPEYAGEPVAGPPLPGVGPDAVRGTYPDFHIDRPALTLSPIHTVFDERYAVYHLTNPGAARRPA